MLPCALHPNRPLPQPVSSRQLHAWSLSTIQIAFASNPVVVLALQAKVLQVGTKNPAEAKQSAKFEQDDPPQHETVQHAADVVWSSMLQKVIQQEARSKKFDEVWPHIVDTLIRKGFTGVY